jgi:hypothetical protein
LLVELSKLVAKELGKPEAYVMTAIESGARTYIEFADGTGYLWGYDGETF